MSNTPPTATIVPIGQFSGRLAFEKLVRDALSLAAQEGWQELILSDATFVDWPLRERAVLESLQAWSASGRHMTLLASRYDDVIRYHARFVAWRKTWDHIIDCRVCRTVATVDFPSAIWSPNWFMQRLDPLRSVGVCGTERARLTELHQALTEKIRDSSPGFPASNLGL
jgi:hypothetical protein